MRRRMCCEGFYSEGTSHCASSVRKAVRDSIPSEAFLFLQRGVLPPGRVCCVRTPQTLLLFQFSSVKESIARRTPWGLGSVAGEGSPPLPSPAELRQVSRGAGPLMVVQQPHSGSVANVWRQPWQENGPLRQWNVPSVPRPH
ncbi:unnamed protein product [Gadus morhua 'NCC']